ncbi:hypothetical protein [Craterilacuibacter sp.]|uniref:hypothetical protein n=1 Tax=Craterilacuibacter sp. TaxID=2870909 RepID=UPI003F3D6630
MGAKTAMSALLAVMGLLTACATTSTVHSQWQDPAYQGGPIKSAVVLALGASVTEQRIFEDSVVAQLNALGVRATTAYSVLPPSPAPLAEADLENAVRKAGVQGFMLIKLLPPQTGYQSVSQPVFPPPVFGWYGAYQGFYSSEQILLPYTIAASQTTLWDTRTRRLLWSGNLQSFNPASVTATASAYAATLSKTLQQGGLLP